MPKSGDIKFVSTTAILNGVDYTKAGADLKWDFSALMPLTGKYDTCYSVSITPITYRFVFNSASFARKQNFQNLVPGISLSDVYMFFKSSSTLYSEIGIGAKLNGIPIPVKYSNSDVVYRFPMKYLNQDSSIMNFSFSLAGMGYISQMKKRHNTVDGWGELTTPYGKFSVLRVKSVIYEKDSVYLDTLGIPIPAIERNYTEYKWLANGFGVPLLQITEEAMVLRVEYLDSVHHTISIDERKLINEFCQIYPNPLKDNLSISLNNDIKEAEISVYDCLGQRVYHQSSSALLINIDFSAQPKGLYSVNIRSEKNTFCKKIIKL